MNISENREKSKSAQKSATYNEYQRLLESILEGVYQKIRCKVLSKGYQITKDFYMEYYGNVLKIAKDP